MIDFSEVADGWKRLTFTDRRRMGFYQDLANANEAGIAPIAALTRMRDVSAPRRSLRWLVRLLNPMLEAAANGQSFANAVRPWVPPEDAAMLSAGEEVGDLTSALRELVSLMRMKLQIRASLKKNLLPSAVMIAVIFGLLVFILNLIGPQAKEMVPPEVMSTLDLLPSYIATGEFFMQWGLFLVGALLSGAGVLWLSLARWRPDSAREHLDGRLPPYSLFARVQTAFFLISVSSMMRAGRTFRSAVEQLQGFATPWSYDYYEQMLDRLRAGMPEVQAMQVGMLPTDVADRLNFYALLPDFGAVMRETARDAMDALLARVEAVGALMRALTMLLLAGFVVWTLASVYDMADGVERAAKLSQFGG